MTSSQKIDRQFSDLPVELKRLIFNNLNVLDLPKCCLVSREWKYLASEYEAVELIAASHKKRVIRSSEGHCIHSELCTWYKTNRRINDQNLVKIHNLNDLLSLPFSLLNLKYLKINGSLILLPFGLTVINKLIKLEQLEFSGIKLNCEHQDELLLNLPDLRTLYICRIDLIKSRYNPHKRLKIDTPQLINFNCGHEMELINLLYPESVQHLKIDFYDYDENVLEPYSQVKQFECYELSSIRAKIIDDLPNLEILRFNYAQFGVMNKFYKQDYFDIERVLDNIIERKMTLKKDSLKIYFNDIELNAGHQSFRDYGFYKDFDIEYEDREEDQSSDSMSDSLVEEIMERGHNYLHQAFRDIDLNGAIQLLNDLILSDLDDSDDSSNTSSSSDNSSDFTSDSMSPSSTSDSEDSESSSSSSTSSSDTSSSSSSSNMSSSSSCSSFDNQSSILSVKKL